MTGGVMTNELMKNIFVVGLDDFHLDQMKTLPESSHWVFHSLFRHDEVKRQREFPVARLLDEGVRRLRTFPGRVDAVIGYWDFPVSTTLPILRGAVGLPGPSLEAVLKCEHKYWSRICQAEAVPEHVPRFRAIDPFSDRACERIELEFPFWLKPVKAVLSHLGFRIGNREDLEAAVHRIRDRIHRYAEPFNQILALADLPPEIAAVDGFHCIAESMISAGLQCTQEGFACDGDVSVYGTVDSTLSGPAGSCFSRYSYPSALPDPVLDRMKEISRRVIQHIGYDQGPFNIEYYWDPTTDLIRLLEINPRISKSHSSLFYLVDGVYHHRVNIDLGLGRKPRFPKGRGICPLAAKFMVRRYADARVVRAPNDAEIEAVEAAIPFTRVQIPVREGMRLSELRDQDSYSFEVATVFIGGRTEADITGKFRTCLDRLPLRFESISEIET